ncbi:MAG: hypothetical protein WC551_12505 [Patescibacteria group bacterium]
MDLISIIRNLLMLAGGVIAGAGWMTETEWAELVGIILPLGVFIWKFIVARKRKAELEELKAK